MKREVRIRQVPKTFAHNSWTYQDQPVVKLGEVGRWAMVRHADHSNAMPFVIGLKDWDKLPIKVAA